MQIQINLNPMASLSATAKPKKAAAEKPAAAAKPVSKANAKFNAARSQWNRIKARVLKSKNQKTREKYTKIVGNLVKHLEGVMAKSAKAIDRKDAKQPGYKKHLDQNLRLLKMHLKEVSGKLPSANAAKIAAAKVPKFKPKAAPAKAAKVAAPAEKPVKKVKTAAVPAKKVAKDSGIDTKRNAKLDAKGIKPKPVSKADGKAKIDRVNKLQKRAADPSVKRANAISARIKAHESGAKKMKPEEYKQAQAALKRLIG